MTARAAFAALLALAGCGELPRDIDGTLERVRAERSFRLGVVAGSGAVNGLVSRVEEAAGASAARAEGSTEPLLVALEEGRLDLVIGEFAADSPWTTRVWMMPPPDRARLSVAARNGENAWIALVHRAAAP